MYAEYASPKTAILKGNREETKKGSKQALVWNEESDCTSEGTKQALLSAVGLQLVDPDRGFVLRTDASNYAIGAVLEQVLDKGRHVPVALWNQSWRKARGGHGRPVRRRHTPLSWLSGTGPGTQPCIPSRSAGPSESAVVAQGPLDTPSGPASRRASWHETWAKFDLTVVCVPGKDNTVADCLSRWAYLASKGMTDISAHGDEAETAEDKKIIDMERMMEEEDVKCFVIKPAEAPLERRVSRAVRVLAPEGAESDKHLFPESCLKNDWTEDYAKSQAFESEYRAVTDPDYGQKWPRGLTEEDGKLYRNGRLLVPKSLVLELCEAWHHHMMHPGTRKQAIDMQRRLAIDETGLYNAIQQITGVPQSVRPAILTIGMSRGKRNGRRFLTSSWSVCPWMSSPCPKYILEKKFSIVWSYVWTNTAATWWPSGRAKRGC